MTLWMGSSGWICGAGGGTEFHINTRCNVIDCFPGRDGWTPMAAEVFVRRILPRIALQHGGTVLQAVAMDCGDGAVLLCGPSHVGKSTLATSLHHALGWRVLSDDMTVLARDVAGVRVLPTEVGSCLWEDSVRAVGQGATNRWRKLSAYATKYRDEQCLVRPRESRPVRAVYLLGSPSEAPADCHALRSAPVRHQQALATLFNLLVRFDPTDHRADASYFKVLASLVSVVTTRLLEFPRRFDLLTEVTARILEDLHADRGEGKHGARPH
jgi:hypothetical protein